MDAQQLPWDLSLCVGRSTVAKGRHGVGARQAPTAEPAMLWALLEAVAHATQNDTAAAPALVVTYLQVFGCLRVEHLHRSKVLKANSHSVYFLCPRGKQKGQRHGFLWAAMCCVPAREVHFEHGAPGDSGGGP